MSKPFDYLALAALALLPGVALADARADVLAAFDAAMARSSYRAVSVSQVKGRDYPTTIDVQLPGSFHMTTPDTEMIILPGGTWMKAGGQWTKFPMDMSKTVQAITVAAMKEGASALQDVQQAGSETINGCDTDIYTYRVDGKFMGIRSNADVQLFVCGDSGLPVRVVSSDARGKSRTVIDYDFETQVAIRAPN